MIGGPHSMWYHVRDTIALSDVWETAAEIASRTGFSRSNIAMALSFAGQNGCVEVTKAHRPIPSKYRKVQSAPELPHEALSDL